MFQYVKDVDAVGTLYHQACIMFRDYREAGHKAEAAKFDRLLKALEECHLELVNQSKAGA